MERDPRQDRDGLHVDVDGDQVIAATLDHAQIKAMERDDDSGKSHSALELESSSTCFVLFLEGICHV
jgi:hypothetical protein